MQAKKKPDAVLMDIDLVGRMDGRKAAGKSVKCIDSR